MGDRVILIYDSSTVRLRIVVSDGVGSRTCESGVTRDIERGLWSSGNHEDSIVAVAIRHKPLDIQFHLVWDGVAAGMWCVPESCKYSGHESSCRDYALTYVLKFSSELLVLLPSGMCPCEP